jgi:hypothetical protein
MRNKCDEVGKERKKERTKQKKKKTVGKKD